MTVQAEVSGLDHLANISVSHCKPSDVEKPKPTEVGALCMYRHRLCDVLDSGKPVLEGAFIDVDCQPDDSTCPDIDKCAKSKLPERVATFVHLKNDPNSDNGPDGASVSIEGGAKKPGTSR